MHFERPELIDRCLHNRPSRRILDGLVRGLPDCWVVVAREEKDLAEWMDSELSAVQEAPLRVCREIRDDDVLVLTRIEEDLPAVDRTRR